MKQKTHSIIIALWLAVVPSSAQPQSDSSKRLISTPDSIDSIQTTTQTNAQPSAIDSMASDSSGYTIYDFDTHRNHYRITRSPAPATRPVVAQKPSSGTLIYAPADQQPVSQQPSPASRRGGGTMFNPEIRSVIQSAKNTAYTGAVFYGLGLGLQLIGVLVLVNDVSNYSTYSNDPLPMTGLYITLIGGATSLGGSIGSNIGGSKAQTIYEAVYTTAPLFNGWKYFGAGITCSVLSTVLGLAMAGEAQALPMLFSIAGFVFTTSSVVSSCGYANRLHIRSLAIHEIKLDPVVGGGSVKTIGLRLTGDFSLLHR